MAVSRRAFLTAAVGGALLGGGFAGSRAVERARDAAVQAWADGLDELAATASARDLGVEYLTRYPDEAQQATLVAGLADAASPLVVVGAGDGLPQRFRAQVRRDFERGDVVRMGGWMLARSTLRLCALCALGSEAGAGTHGLFSEQALPGGPVRWTAPTARWQQRVTGARVAFRLRSGGPDRRQTTLRIGGRPIETIDMAGSEWRQVSYPVDATARVVSVELETTPVWRPAHDFRSIGVGLAWNDAGPMSGGPASARGQNRRTTASEAPRGHDPTAADASPTSQPSLSSMTREL